MKKLSIDETLAKRIILPTSKSKISWDIFICFVYLNSLFDDSFYNVMGLYPLALPAVKITQTFASFCMVVDIFLTFFTAYEKEQKIEFDEQEQKKLNKKKGNKVSDSII